MSTEQLPGYYAGRIVAAVFNGFRSVLCGDLVPRSPVFRSATDLAGSLGSPEIPFSSGNITVGDAWAGVLLTLYDYNGKGAYPGHGVIPEGAMLCDGRIINQTNYDVEHGIGSWEKFIGSSPLEGRYLPTIDDAYMVGGAVTHDGVTPFPTIGVPGNQLDLSHAHGGTGTTGGSANPNTLIGGSSAGGGASGEGHVHTFPIGPASESLVKSIKPATIIARAYMRII